MMAWLRPAAGAFVLSFCAMKCMAVPDGFAAWPIWEQTEYVISQLNLRCEATWVEDRITTGLVWRCDAGVASRVEEVTTNRYFVVDPLNYEVIVPELRSNALIQVGAYTQTWDEISTTNGVVTTQEVARVFPVMDSDWFYTYESNIVLAANEQDCTVDVTRVQGRVYTNYGGRADSRYLDWHLIEEITDKIIDLSEVYVDYDRTTNFWNDVTSTNWHYKWIQPYGSDNGSWVFQYCSSYDRGEQFIREDRGGFSVSVDRGIYVRMDISNIIERTGNGTNLTMITHTDRGSGYPKIVTNKVFGYEVGNYKDYSVSVVTQLERHVITTNNLPLWTRHPDGAVTQIVLAGMSTVIDPDQSVSLVGFWPDRFNGTYHYGSNSTWIGASAQIQAVQITTNTDLSDFFTPDLYRWEIYEDDVMAFHSADTFDSFYLWEERYLPIGCWVGHDSTWTAGISTARGYLTTDTSKEELLDLGSRNFSSDPIGISEAIGDQVYDDILVISFDTNEVGDCGSGPIMIDCDDIIMEGSLIITITGRVNVTNAFGIYESVQTSVVVQVEDGCGEYPIDGPDFTSVDYLDVSTNVVLARGMSIQVVGRISSSLYVRGDLASKQQVSRQYYADTLAERLSAIEQFQWTPATAGYYYTNWMALDPQNSPFIEFQNLDQYVQSPETQILGWSSDYVVLTSPPRELSFKHEYTFDSNYLKTESVDEGIIEYWIGGQVVWSSNVLQTVTNLDSGTSYVSYKSQTKADFRVRGATNMACEAHLFYYLDSDDDGRLMSGTDVFMDAECEPYYWTGYRFSSRGGIMDVEVPHPYIDQRCYQDCYQTDQYRRWFLYRIGTKSAATADAEIVGPHDVRDVTGVDVSCLMPRYNWDDDYSLTCSYDWWAGIGYYHFVGDISYTKVQKESHANLSAGASLIPRVLLNWTFD